MKLRLLGLMLAAIMALAITAPALGRSYHPSRVTISRSAPQFHGRVFLRHALKHPRLRRPCRTHRLVKLYWTNHGGHTKLVGTTRTTRRGRWVITTHAHHGTYFARAKRRVLPRRNHAICGAATSRHVSVGGHGQDE